MVLIEISPATIFELLKIWQQWYNDLPLDDKDIDRAILKVLKVLNNNKQIESLKDQLTKSNF